MFSCRDEKQGCFANDEDSDDESLGLAKEEKFYINVIEEGEGVEMEDKDSAEAANQELKEEEGDAYLDVATKEDDKGNIAEIEERC